MRCIFHETCLRTFPGGGLNLWTHGSRIRELGIMLSGNPEFSR